MHYDQKRTTSSDHMATCRRAVHALLTVTLIAALSGVSGCRPRQEEQKAGALVCAEGEQRFADRFDDEAPMIERTFRLHNRSSRPVKVLSLRPSCGCTKVTASTNTVVSEAWADVRVECDLKGRLGDQEFAVRVVTDERDAVPCLLTLRGRIVRRFEVIPAGLDFGVVPWDGEASRTFAVRRNDGKPLERDLLDPGAAEAGGAVRFEEVGGDANPAASRKWKVTVRGRPVESPLCETALLYVNGRQEPPMAMHLVGRFAGIVRLAKERVFLGMMRPGEEARVAIGVRAARPNLELAAHVEGGAGIEATLHRTGDEELELRLVVRAADVPGKFVRRVVMCREGESAPEKLATVEVAGWVVGSR